MGDLVTPEPTREQIEAVLNFTEGWLSTECPDGSDYIVKHLDEIVDGFLEAQ